MKRARLFLAFGFLIAASAAAQDTNNFTWANWSRKITDSFKHMQRRKVPGRTMGLLVPADNRDDIFPLTAAAYNVLSRGGFHTVVVFLQAPPEFRIDGLGLPLVSAFETSFGRFGVDTDLRDKLMDGGLPVQAQPEFFQDNPPPALQRQLAYIKFIFRGDTVRLKVLPIYVGFSDPNSQVRDYAPYLIDHIRDAKLENDVFFLAVVDLTKTDSQERTREADGAVLRAIRNLDVDALLEWAGGATGAQLVSPDALAMALLTLRWGGADHTEILAYGDSSRLVLSKDKKNPVSYAAAGFASAPPRPPRIPHVNQDRMLITFDDVMRADILTMTRQAALSAIDATAAKPPPLGHKDASKPWPVYVNIYDEKGKPLGQAGSPFATGPLEESLRRYAVEAVRSANPRLTRETFKSAVVDVSIPFGFNTVGNADDLVPLLNGVVLKAQGKSAAMHPDAWRRYPDPHQLLAEGAYRLDLPPWAYMLNTIKIDSFRVLAFNEKEPFPAMVSPDRKRKKGAKTEDESLPDVGGGNSGGGGGGGAFGF